MASTLTQAYKVEGLDVRWRLILYVSRAKTTVELNYRKVNGESLGILSGIKEHQMFLYGVKSTCAANHEHWCHHIILTLGNYQQG